MSRDTSILPEELATQSVRLKEEQLRREEEKVCFLGYPFLPFIPTNIFSLVTRDRAQSTARDQREKTRVIGEGRVTQVFLVLFC
jgi:hypothetical protein